jgi:hypothetical protein
MEHYLECPEEGEVIREQARERGEEQARERGEG